MAGSVSRPWRRPGLRPWPVRNLLDSVSARLIALILFSVVPLAALGSLMAWHNYQSTLNASTSRAVVVAEALAGQFDQQIADSERLLHAVARQPGLRDPAGCTEMLQLARMLRIAPLDDLVLLDAHGAPACGFAGAHTDIGASPARSPPAADAAVALQPMLGGDAKTTTAMLRLSLPATGPQGAATLVADMPLGWTPGESAATALWQSRLGPGGDAEAWLVGPDGREVPLCAGCGWTDRRADKASGVRGRYLKHALVADIDLLVTTQPSRRESHALMVFLWRVIAIALLLTLGLVAVGIGAGALIVAPLRAVTRSVTEWRRAGAYDPRHTRWTPIELRQLSRAFTQAARSLAAHEERLRKAEVNQELLIKEIHHRVKNNLQIIASLLNLQANRIRQPEARAEFASARDRVRALATLHRHLYSEGELHTLNMRPFLEELCGQLFQAIGEKEGRRIRLDIEAPEITMSTDQAVPLALVVTETVSNAIKYAFPGGRSGMVSVRLAEEVEGIATLVIEDDGVGIPAGRAETETGIRDGLGIQLIRGFARQLGATLEVIEGEADENGRSTGTRYTLLVPLHPKVETYAETGAAPEKVDASA